MVSDRLRKEQEALAAFDKGIAYERNWYRYEVAEMKAGYLSQLGRSAQAVTIYESLIKQPFVPEMERERMRKLLQTFLSRSLNSWQ